MPRTYKPSKPTAECDNCGYRWTINRDGKLRNHLSVNGCDCVEPREGTTEQPVR